MRIIDLTPDANEWISQTAKLLYNGFESWSTIESAIKEVNESFADDCISRIMIDADDKVIGWIGGRSQYNGNVWEIHPLVIKESLRKRGLGKTLVQDFESQVIQRGGITVILGTDDEYNLTSLSDKDIYLDIATNIKEFSSKNHPAVFYMKIGYKIVGVIPDANGIGKPDILMAKRISSNPKEGASIT